jgi:hypothetical protein
MESNHHSARHRVYSAGSSPLLSVRANGVTDRIRTDTARLTTPDASVYTTATTKAGTTGFEPAASRLTSERSARLSYAPEVARVGFEPTVSSS